MGSVGEFLSKFVRALIRRIVKKISIGDCNYQIEKYDYLFLSPSLAEQMYSGNNPAYGFLIDLKAFPQEKIIFFPETFDQFKGSQEYSNFRLLDDFSNFFICLARDHNCGIGNKIGGKLGVVGSPRYSKYWCNKLGDFYKQSKLKTVHSYITILYLPIKASPPVDWLKEEIKIIDQKVFALLDRFDDVRVIVKPHPRTVGYYDDLTRFTIHRDRVEVFETMVDTAELAERSQICITPGTSFIPHLFWRNIPVVLLDGWAKRLGKEFLLDSFCFCWVDLDGLLDKLRHSEKIDMPFSERSLENMFQCGVSSKEYQEYLKYKLKKI
jgi:hypothetical protein